MFVVQASRLPKAAETAAPQLLSNLRLSWNKALDGLFGTGRIRNNGWHNLAANYPP